MNVILDVFSIDDKTVRSCEPNSLIAVNHAIRNLSYKMRHSRIKIKHLYVEAEDPVHDTEHPLMHTRVFTVKIGFNVKEDWYNSEIHIKYYYAPGGCMNTDIKIVKLGKQIGKYPNIEFEDLLKKQEDGKDVKSTSVNLIKVT